MTAVGASGKGWQRREALARAFLMSANAVVVVSDQPGSSEGFFVCLMRLDLNGILHDKSDTLT